MSQERKRFARDYLRVSEDTSGRMRSCDEQRDEHQRIASDEGVTLGDPYLEDEAVSASRYARKARKGFASLIADLEADRFAPADVDPELWLWESSRGSRKLSEWARFLELLEERNVRVRVATHDRIYDLSKARDRRTLQEDGVAAEYESAQTSDRVSRSHRANAVDGHPHGTLTFGFRRVYEITTAGKRILVEQVPDEVQAPLVREMFDDADSGLGASAIALKMMRRGIKTPRGHDRWRASTVTTMLRNKAYLGHRVHHGKVSKENAWPAIIEQDQFDRVQARLNDPSKRRSGDVRTKYLLSGIAVCDACGHKLYQSKKSTTAGPRYRCVYPMCQRVVRNAAWLDQHVAERVVALIAKRQDEALVDDGRDPALSAAIQHLDALKARLALWVDSALDMDGPSPATIAKVEAQLLPQIEAAERRVQDLRVPAALNGITGPIADVWESLPLEKQRELIAATAEVRVAPVGRGQRLVDRGVIVAPQ